LKHLKTLILSSSQITDQGLETLTAFPHLEQLVLAGSQITDGGLEQIAQLKSLKSLNLSDTNIGDAGIAHLKSLSGLEQLYLNNTQVTRAGVQQLKEALPELTLFGRSPSNDSNVAPLSTSAAAGERYFHGEPIAAVKDRAESASDLRLGPSSHDSPARVDASDVPPPPNEHLPS
jgi:Leucine-rich repeat (LRR) protein